MRSIWLVLGLCFVIVCCLAVAWHALYPSANDPKNIRYVLWKRGLYPLNLDIALGTMIADRDRDTLVLGRSKEQLRKRFGYLLSPDQTSEYYRNIYLERGYGDALFLRGSPWLVVFSDGRASKLIFIKGA